MKQVFVQRGQVAVEEAPVPLCRPGGVLVRTAWSVLSAGTERTDVSSQRVLERLRRQPEAIGKVWQQLKRAGLQETARLVREKLERPIALGNSLSGLVVEVGGGVHDFAVGDHVACGGTGHAHHAEYVWAPRNLTSRVPDGLPLRDAAFVTLGAIALQGVRRAQVQIGETVVVIGLGLIGLLTVQILRAAGARVIGVDPRADRLSLAERLGVERGLVAGEGGNIAAVLASTRGHGADAVLLTAATASSDPVNQAFELAREKARIVIVGDVGLHLSRPTFYRKELDLVISRSTGPGRYDPVYEERGVDYPLGHVRWTEQRNMEAFLRLLDAGAVRVVELIGGEYAIADAPLAYGALKSSGPGVAVLFRYAPEREIQPVRSLALRAAGPTKPGLTGVAVIGVGEFARHTLLPILGNHPDVRLRAIVGGSSGKGIYDARRFGAEVYATDAQEVLKDPAVDAVVIATRHHLHASLAIEAARRGKAIFTEKPLALTAEECHAVAETVAQSRALLTVGFNRRFAPLARRAQRALADVAGPALAIYRINARALPRDHWLHDPVEGGGTILGEGCHFFDLLCWLLGEEPMSVQAIGPAGEGEIPEELAVSVGFSGGSVGTVLYTTSGHPSLAKERVEVFKGGRAVVLDDLRLLTVDGVKTHAGPDEKGYQAEIETFVRAVRGQSPLEVTLEDGIRATILALRAIESAVMRKAVPVDWKSLL